jgi:opacity protein-like surface antigen
MKRILLTIVCIALAAGAAFAQEAPLWLTRRGAIYPPEQYVSGVGEGGTAEEARTRALARIAQFFQTKVGDTKTLLYAYNDALAAAEHTQASQDTVISSEAEFFGVEFADVYRDKTGVYHALAYIDREEAGKKYEARIQANALTLGELIKRYENSPNPRLAVKRLREARRLAVATAEYADMATLLNSEAGPRYTVLPAIVTGIDSAIEANERRFTATISLNDKSAASVALKTAEILRRAGFLLADSGGVYTVFVNFAANENATKNYHTMEPVLDIIIEAQDGTPLVTYTKKYPLFRHVTREEALARALRNIEQDLGGEFAKEAGRIGE